MLTLLLLACQPKPADGATPAPAPLPAEFWATWGDGKAELASYDLAQPRYGALRKGTAVAIFVTEDFSYEARIKADPGAHPDGDIRKVMKLNLTRDFQTGIYPYHVMTSTFLRLEPGDGMATTDPLKMTTSVQEWCGHVLDRWIPSPGKLSTHQETYFDSDDAHGNGNPPASLRIPGGTIYGDALPILVRELGGPWIPQGESRQFAYVPRQIDLRFSHTEPTVGSVTVTRTAEGFTAAISGGETFTFLVDPAWPHHLRGWSSTSGESATLRAVDRLPYWSLNGPGDEAYREKIGLGG